MNPARTDNLKLTLRAYAQALAIVAALVCLLAWLNFGATPIVSGDSRGDTVVSVMGPLEKPQEGETETIMSPADWSPMLATTLAKIQQPEITVKADFSDVAILDLATMNMPYSSLDAAAMRRSHAGTLGTVSLADIDSPLQSVFIPPNLFPDELIKRGVTSGTVKVIMEVDARGRATVKEVLGCTHPELIAPVVQSVNQAIYTAPLKNGRPAVVTIARSVNFNADPERASKVRARSEGESAGAAKP